MSRYWLGKKSSPNSRWHDKFELESMSRKVQKLSNKNWKWIDVGDESLSVGFDFEPFRNQNRPYGSYFTGWSISDVTSDIILADIIWPTFMCCDLYYMDDLVRGEYFERFSLHYRIVKYKWDRLIRMSSNKTSRIRIALLYPQKSKEILLHWESSVCDTMHASYLMTHSANDRIKAPSPKLSL